MPRGRLLLILTGVCLVGRGRYPHQGWFRRWTIAMKDGAIVAEGPPAEVVSEDAVRKIFGMDCRVVTDEVSGTPLVLPVGRRHADPGAALRS